MRRFFTISIVLNLLFICGLIFGLVERKSSNLRQALAVGSVTSSASPVNFENLSATNGIHPQSFHWAELESPNDYRKYVAKLRAIGCPEPTINDIVRGDAARAFAFKRAQLGLDGSGNGPWSRSREAGLVASLLGIEADTQPAVSGNSFAEMKMTDAGEAPGALVENAVPSENSQRTVSTVAQPVYPVAFRKIDLAALGFGAGEKAAIAQVQNQFIKDIGGQNQNPNDPAYLARWQKAQVDADDALRGALGSQEYMAFIQQQYYDWYKPQVPSGNASGGQRLINPALFSVQP